MAKVVGVSNFNLETMSDVLVKDGLTWAEAEQLVRDHNDKMHTDDPVYYRAVADDYKLYKFEP